MSTVVFEIFRPSFKKAPDVCVHRDRSQENIFEQFV